MQPILVAIDFSNTSIHALEYAISMANKMKTDIVLVWVDKVTGAESLYPDTSNDNRQEAKKRFEELLEQYNPMLHTDLHMEYKLRKGKVYHEIENVAHSVSADLIVVGSHGISGFEEYWIGSNASRIITYASCPVITVRLNFPIHKSISRIMVPIDGSSETIQKIPYVARLAKLFKSEVHVVTTHYTHLKSVQRLAEKNAQITTNYFESNHIRYHEDTLISSDITKSVIQYAMGIDADLIGMMTEQETPAHILLGTHAQQLITLSPIPVLSVHHQEHFCL
ncbi:MAG: universal stress protein [Bacteroidota bacterium]|nr:universal stress protein [Bacteroidota bacterium]